MRIAAVVVVSLCLLPTAASAQQPPTPEPQITPIGPDKKRMRFSYGPLHVSPGHNLILVGPVTIEKPAYDGYITRFKPDLVRADGTPPPVDVIHLHHGVWLNLGRPDRTAGRTERIAASGEEKTIFEIPDGYGYPLGGADVLALNYMLHNQTPVPENVWITYEIDFVKKGSPAAAALKPAYPLWMDVRNGEAYPVFDVKRGWDTDRDGRYTYPDDATSPYNGSPRNVWTVPAGGGTLLWSAGHVHPGGLYTDLEVERAGAGRRLLFRSEATYFNNRPPISWDMAMTVTPPNWRVGLRGGDKLRLKATYETEHASWYESMGINMAFWSPGEQGPDPFVTPPATRGEVTHGSLPENSNFGGDDTGAPDPDSLPSTQSLGRNVGIFGFLYTPGNFGTFGPIGNPPEFDRSAPIRFHNGDASAQIFHTITACKEPCNRSTGIGYPLANGDIDFDSGELGYGPTGLTAAANRHNWDLETTGAAPGTYTYFCRVHPYMRGAVRLR